MILRNINPGFFENPRFFVFIPVSDLIPVLPTQVER
jgi:hypothetical protein